jgi:predicted enzyme related to lactoylglutathione lyase
VHKTIGVPLVDEFVGKIEEAGGKVIAPKMAIPGAAPPRPGSNQQSPDQKA